MFFFLSFSYIHKYIIYRTPSPSDFILTFTHRLLKGTFLGLQVNFRDKTIGRLFLLSQVENVEDSSSSLNWSSLPSNFSVLLVGVSSVNGRDLHFPWFHGVVVDLGRS